MNNNLTSKRRKPYKQILKEFPDVLDITQMCSILGISTKTGYALLKKGDIRSIKAGRAYKIPKLNLIKYLNL